MCVNKREDKFCVVTESSLLQSQQHALGVLNPLAFVNFTKLVSFWENYADKSPGAPKNYSRGTKATPTFLGRCLKFGIHCAVNKRTIFKASTQALWLSSGSIFTLALSSIRGVWLRIPELGVLFASFVTVVFYVTDMLSF